MTQKNLISGSHNDGGSVQNLQDAVKVMAKSLVRNRHAVTKMYGLKSQLQAVSLRIAVRPHPSHSHVHSQAVNFQK